MLQRFLSSSSASHLTRLSLLSTAKAPRLARAFSSDSLKSFQLGILNHVAIAVPDLAAATILYRDVMGASVSPVLDLPAHGVSTVFVNLGNTKIELLHPLGQSPISNFLAKNPSGGVHHICLEVDDLSAACASLVAQGIRSLDPKPKIGAHGKWVMFFHPKDLNGVLIELEQK